MPDPMDAARWTAVQTLFDAALDLPPAERDTFLRDACGDDSDLYREVASLLNIEVHSLLRGLALDAVDVSAVLSREGERVGPYRIEKEIGRGGMGAVFLAERADGAFEQTVALKLVKRGMDSDAVLRRFEQERQILARLQNPGIARLLDGGLATDGRPYFAMEVVEGEPITAYCDARALNVDDRLALFERVCDAVAYAHRNLVVHRDLKPSNILVTTDGEVKLLDFGIARLLEADGPGLTWSGLRPMTPEYAAPEQVRGQAITTATDVYALGALLYELLTGRRPHALVDRDLQSIEKAICEAEPERPSLAVGRTVSATAGDGVHTVTPAGVSHARGTTPDRLRRQLSGDLDTITLKALRKEPERRYGSADALAADLRRYRDGIPVKARRSTVGYRVRKYVMRHRAGVAATAAAVALLAAVIGFYTARLTAERDRAQLEATKAAEVAEFLQGIFEVSDPSVAKGETVTARELLDEGAARVERELVGQPEVQAEMMSVMGRVYVNLGLHEDAHRLHEQALNLRRATYGERSAPVAASLYDLGWVRALQGDFPAAESLHIDALALRRDLLEPDHPDVLASLGEVARVYRSQGRYPEAESLYVDILQVRRSNPTTSPSDLANAMFSRGSLHQQLQRDEEAMALFSEAIDLMRTVEPRDELNLTRMLNSTAVLHAQHGNSAEAEALFREALEVRRAYLGDSSKSVAQSLGNFSTFLHDMGKIDEAEVYAHQAIASYGKAVGEDHPDYAYGLTALAAVRVSQGRCDEAEPLYRQAAGVQERAVGPTHWFPNAIRYVLASECLVPAERYAEAERILATSYENISDVLGESAPYTLDVREGYAKLYDVWGKPDKAAALR
jgi:serine/threonine-protein kinase